MYFWSQIFSEKAAVEVLGKRYPYKKPKLERWRELSSRGTYFWSNHLKEISLLSWLQKLATMDKPLVTICDSLYQSSNV